MNWCWEASTQNLSQSRNCGRHWLLRLRTLAEVCSSIFKHWPITAWSLDYQHFPATHNPVLVLRGLQNISSLYCTSPSFSLISMCLLGFQFLNRGKSYNMPLMCTVILLLLLSCNESLICSDNSQERNRVWCFQKEVLEIASIWDCSIGPGSLWSWDCKTRVLHLSVHIGLKSTIRDCLSGCDNCFLCLVNKCCS